MFILFWGGGGNLRLKGVVLKTMRCCRVDTVMNMENFSGLECCCVCAFVCLHVVTLTLRKQSSVCLSKSKSLDSLLYSKYVYWQAVWLVQHSLAILHLQYMLISLFLKPVMVHLIILGL